MTNTVTFPTTGGADAFSGKVASDGGPGTGDAFLDQDGHRTWFIVILQWLILWGAWLMGRAGVAFVATSSTNITISSTGDYGPFTVATGLTIPVGAYCSAASNASPAANRLDGVVKTYNSGTGALVLTVTTATGSGAHTDWTIASSGPRGATGAAGSNTGSKGVTVTGSDVERAGVGALNTSSSITLAASGVSGGQLIADLQLDSGSGAQTITLPPTTSPTPTVGDRWRAADATMSWATHNLTVAANGNKINGVIADVTVGSYGLPLGAIEGIYTGSTFGWYVRFI